MTPEAALDTFRQLIEQTNGTPAVHRQLAEAFQALHALVTSSPSEPSAEA